MTPEQLEQVLEAAIFAAAEPLTINQLAQMIHEEDRPERDAIKAALDNIMQSYENRGVQLKQVASGYQFTTNPETSAYMQRLLERKPPRYSRALLETLALIIYRQPITRGEIEQVRGVAVSTKIIQTLTDREWVQVVGHKAVPGQPALYAPTKQLFDYFNIKSMEDLPPLADLVDLDNVGEKLSKQLALSIPEEQDQQKLEDAVLNVESEAGDAVLAEETLDESSELEASLEDELASELSESEDLIKEEVSSTALITVEIESTEDDEVSELEEA